MPNRSCLLFRHCAEWRESPGDSTAAVRWRSVPVHLPVLRVAHLLWHCPKHHPALTEPPLAAMAAVPVRVCSGGSGAGFPQHAAAVSSPGRDRHWSGQLTAGIACLVPEWPAQCHVPVAQPALLQVWREPWGPWLWPLASAALLCANRWWQWWLFLILFFRKESELSPKGLCLSDSPRLQIRLELLFHVPLHADYLLVFSLWLSGPVAHLFVFSHFVFLTMISSLSSAKHLHSDSQFTWSCLALLWIRTWNCVGSLQTKVKGSPAHFLRPQFKLTCWHQTSIIRISRLWSDPDKPTALQDLELGSNLLEKSLTSSCPSFYIILYYYLMSSSPEGVFKEKYLLFHNYRNWDSPTVPKEILCIHAIHMCCPIRCDLLQIYSDILLLIFHYFFCFGHAVIPAWEIPRWKTSEHLPFSTPADQAEDWVYCFCSAKTLTKHIESVM